MALSRECSLATILSFNHVNDVNDRVLELLKCATAGGWFGPYESTECYGLSYRFKLNEHEPSRMLKTFHKLYMRNPESLEKVCHLMKGINPESASPSSNYRTVNGWLIIMLTLETAYGKEEKGNMERIILTLEKIHN